MPRELHRVRAVCHKAEARLHVSVALANVEKVSAHDRRRRREKEVAHGTQKWTENPCRRTETF
jgi:hypothetical protein